MKYRIKFFKIGSMKFIGHLDVMRYFQKAFRRTDIEVKLSEGFSPHQIISFASPLGIGLMTTGDYLDVELTDELEIGYIKEELNAVMNDEIGVISVSKLEDTAKTSMAVLAAADYAICIKPEKQEHFEKDFFEKIEDNIKGFLDQDEILVTKKTKKSERVMDIKDNIYFMERDKKSFEEKTGLAYTDESFDYDYYRPIFFIRLTQGSVLNIKPETVIESFCTYAGVKFDSLDYQLNRLEMLADKNGEKGKVNTMTSEVKCNLISLDRWQAI